MKVRVFGSIALAAGAAVLLPAQQAGETGVRVERSAETRVFVRSAGIGVMPESVRADIMHVMPFEAGPGVRSMKNAPYSAEAVTEFKQQLGDGNRITRRNSDLMYRDSEGRTRKEQTVTNVGPWATAGSKIINIWDPTTSTNLVLDPQNKTVRKMVMKFDTSGNATPGEAIKIRTAMVGSGMAGGARGGGPVAGAVVMDPAAVAGLPAPPPPGAPAGPGVMTFTIADSAAGGAAAQKVQLKREDLGKRMFEGVEAQGTRTIETIEAGAIGNERAIEVISERWFSPELGVLVMSRHVDPRMGESTYTLTNIRRAEPSRDLFEAPADFRVNEDSNMKWFEKIDRDEKK